MKGKKINLAENMGEVEAVGKRPYYPSVNLRGDQIPNNLWSKDPGQKCKLHSTANLSDKTESVNKDRSMRLELMDMMVE